MPSRRGNGGAQTRTFPAQHGWTFDRTSLWARAIFGSVASPNVWVRVRFTEPVEGPDPYASRRTTDETATNSSASGFGITALKPYSGSKMK